MKYFVICALAAIVLFQATAGFRRRVIYVVPAPTTDAPSNATTNATNATNAATNATVTNPNSTNPAVPYTVVHCSWKNNWCRPASNTVRNCRWGICKFNG